jgi:drug/metabolite transporter (DMT)-like permease
LLYTFGLAAFFLLLYNLVPAILPSGGRPVELFWLGDSTLGWAILIVLAIGPTIGGYGFYTLSLAYLPASVANLVATLEPPLTALLSFIILGERFTIAQWIGSALIVCGLVILRRGEGGMPLQE